MNVNQPTKDRLSNPYVLENLNKKKKKNFPTGIYKAADANQYTSF